MFSREDMKSSVAEFLRCYAERPVRDNDGGMGLNHSWATWYLLRRLQPPVVVESGVFKGYSTWLIEQAVPGAQLYAFDVELRHRRYRSERVRYAEHDFTQFDWSGVDTTNAVCFFDDHQNAYQRLQQMAWFGFRRAIFEDNWPVGQGDCYSLRHLRAGAGATSVQMSAQWSGSAWARLKRRRFERRLWLLGHRQDLLVRPNTVDRENLNRRLDVYMEMPPLQLAARTPWNTAWTGDYAAPEPLCPDDDFGGLDLAYGYLAFVALKDATATP